VTRNKRANVTRNRRTDRFTVEKLAQDCLDVRFLRRMGFFADGWITIGATLKWPRIARMRIARYVMTPALLLVSCFIIGSGMALFGPAWQILALAGIAIAPLPLWAVASVLGGAVVFAFLMDFVKVPLFRSLFLA
jgi:hypothetical protein